MPDLPRAHVSRRLLTALVLDHDPPTAAIYADMIDNIPRMATIGVAQTLSEAREILRSLHPDLALADIDFVDDPSHRSLDELAEWPCDVLVLGTAIDAATVRTGLARGIFAFFVKPLDLGRLRERLKAYATYRDVLTNNESLSQDQIDRAMRLRHSLDNVDQHVGTRDLIVKALQDRRDPASVAEVAEDLGISRATAQRHLAMLVKQGYARTFRVYGTPGRPENRYELLRK